MADTYEITSINERTKLVPGMGFQEVEDITFRTKPAGIIGTVSIPKDQATPEHVAAVVSAEVDRKHQVKDL